MLTPPVTAARRPPGIVSDGVFGLVVTVYEPDEIIQLEQSADIERTQYAERLGMAAHLFRLSPFFAEPNLYPAFLQTRDCAFVQRLRLMQDQMQQVNGQQTRTDLVRIAQLVQAQVSDYDPLPSSPSSPPTRLLESTRWTRSSWPMPVSYRSSPTW